MRAIASVALLMLCAGCTADDAAPAAVPTDKTDPAIVVQTLPPDLADLPRLRTALPRRIPTDPASLPSLVDDPPGRAAAVYHPPEHWPEPVEGWASETLLFYGVDGEWRRLRMDELGMSDESWEGHDTYGAGALSPDGRWWAGYSHDGTILLDLATGHARILEDGSRRTGSIEWRADSRSMVVWRGVHSMAELLDLPSGRRTALPYRSWQASLAPDGTAYSLRGAGAGRAEVVTWRAGRPVSLGTVRIPGLREQKRLFGPQVSAGHLLVVVQRPPYRTIDLVVVGIDSLEVEARLHLSAHDRLTFRDESWLDPDTVLLETGPGLVAWRPGAGRFFRVTRSPTPGNGFASLEVATDLAR